MSTQSNDRKLTVRELAGLPLANFGPTLQTCIQMYFLLYFFTDVLKIGGTAAALIIMVARIWDFINDPLMAVLVEKTKKPEKCLFWMRVALVPTLIFMILTYTAPQFSTTGKIVWAALMFIGLGMSQTAYSIPLNTLRPQLTSNGAERNRLNTVESLVSLVGNLLIPAVTMPLVAVLQGMEVSAPFMVLAAIYAAVYGICSFAGLKLLKGHEPSAPVTQNDPSSKITVGQMFSAVVVNKMALLVLLMQVVKMFISSTIGASMVYYFTYNVQNLDAMSIQSTIAGLIGLLPILFLVKLYKKFGNAGTALIGCVIALAAMVVRFVTHDASITTLIVMGAVEGIGSQMIVSMIQQCLMDSLDYGEWKTGKKPVAVVMSVYGIGTKIGLAFGTTIAGFILGALNFDSGALVQPDRVLNAFFNINIALPMAMYAVMAVIFIYLRHMEKKLPQMRAEVAARKNGAEV